MSTAAVLPRPKRLYLALAIAASVLLLLAPAAFGRDLYVADYSSDSVSVLDSATGAQAVPPISTGVNTGPYTLAISPSGRFVYVANYDSGTVVTIDTQTKSLVGSPMTVGENPIGIAVSPDGTRAVVCNQSDEDVTILDLQTGQPVKVVPVGEAPQSVAINPSGTRAFVANSGGDTVTAIDLQTNQAVGGPIPVGERPYGIAITPDGSRVLVSNEDSGTVSVIDPASNAVVGAPIPAGPESLGLTITPDGRRAYVGNWQENEVTGIDIASGTKIGPIPGISEPEYIAISPDGKKAFTSAYNEGNVFAFDPVATTFAGGPFATGGGGIGGLAFVPNQPPVAGFSAAARIRPGVPATFDASASHDPDGSIASFAWAFGDGKTATVATPKTTHAFAKPGKYTTTLTLTDNEGCSTSFVFVGQTAYCNGSPVATWALTVKVAFPGVRAKCPKAAKGACKLTLQAVSRKGRKGLKPLSATAKAKVKPGKSAIVSLKPKKASRKKLAKAKKILVRETRTVAGEQRVRVRKLKVVQ